MLKVKKIAGRRRLSVKIIPGFGAAPIATLSSTIPDPRQAAYVAGTVQSNLINKAKVSVKQLDQKSQEFELKAEACLNLSLLVERVP